MIEMKRPRAYWDEKADILHSNQELYDQVVNAPDHMALLEMVLKALPSRQQVKAFEDRMDRAFNVFRPDHTAGPPQVVRDLL